MDALSRGNYKNRSKTKIIIYIIILVILAVLIFIVIEKFTENKIPKNGTLVQNIVSGGGDIYYG